jgi:outer membrane protein TolC
VNILNEYKKQIMHKSNPHFIKKTISVCILLTYGLCTFAQSKLALDLPVALEIAGANNATVIMMQTKEALAKAEYDLAKNWWIPNLKVDADIHQLWGNVMNGDGAFFQDVDRQSFGTGVGLDVTLNLQDGIKNKKLKEYQVRSRTFLSQMERNEYLLEVTALYYQLLGSSLEANSYQILINQSDSIIGQLEVLVKEGLQYNTDLLLAKSNRENHRFQFYNAQNKSVSLKTSLLTLLYQDADTEIVLKDAALIPITLVEENKTINLQNIQSAPEFKYLKNEQAAKVFEKKNLKSGIWMPELRLSAYTSVFGDVFKDILPTHILNAGIGWDIPLSRLTGDDLRVVDLEKTILDQEINILKQRATQQVQQLQTQLVTIQLQIKSSEEAVSNSLLALDEAVQRQKLGLARPFEIERVQEAFIQSRINYLKSVSAFNILQSRLYVLLGNNL